MLYKIKKKKMTNILKVLIIFKIHNDQCLCSDVSCKRALDEKIGWKKFSTFQNCFLVSAPNRKQIGKSSLTACVVNSKGPIWEDFCP